MFSSTASRTVSAFVLRARTPAGAAATIAAAGAALTFQQQSSVLQSSGVASMAEGTGAFSPKEFREFKIRDIEEKTHNVKRFRVDLPSPEDVAGMKTASCIVIRGTGRDGKPVVRPYTPTTTNDTKGYFDLVIKNYPAGNASSYMHGLKEGDAVEVKGPFPKFDYKPNVKKEIGMIAGGTGITPMLQVLQEVTLNPEDETKITLIFANKSPTDIMLKAELDELESKSDNVKIVYLVDSDPEGKWTGLTGYVNPDLLKAHLPAPTSDGVVFVCGPPGMMNAVSGPKNEDKSQGVLAGMLKDLGYTEEMVYKF